MAPSTDSIVIDGLNAAAETRDIFQALRDDGVTAANWTCCGWEDFDETMRNVARWKQRFDEHAELITQVYTVEDIHRAKREGRLGIYLGWQNSSGYNDYLPFVQLFAELGIRLMQLTYNTANAVGSGCYESVDRGLTDFGRDLVRECNRVGVLIDLSHVGPLTGRDTIEASERPVCYSHTLPSALNPHPRNKSDQDLRLIAEHGGFVGATIYPAFLPRGYDSTIADYLDAVEHVIAQVGEDNVGVSTDLTEGRGPEFFAWITHDKGYGREIATAPHEGFPPGLASSDSLFSSLAKQMAARSWSPERISGVMGLNWLRFLEHAWEPSPETPLPSRTLAGAYTLGQEA